MRHSIFLIVATLGLALFSILAYAVTGTLTYSVTAAGTTACDIGPSYTGQIPAAATQAGFTHCAANYDFTQTQSFTDSLGTHQWSNLSSWFICNASSSGSWLLNYAPYVQGVSCDTTHQNIGTDGGTQVLQMSYYLTDAQSGIYNNIITSAPFSTVPAPGTTFPEGFYMEEVIRPSSINVSSSAAIAFTHFMSAVNALSGGSPCYVSEDFDEISSPNPTSNNTGFDLWNPVCGTSSNAFGPSQNPQDPPPSASTYTTYGELVTQDNCGGNCSVNNGNYAEVGYVRSGAISGLQASDFRGSMSFTVVPPSSSQIFTNRNQFGLWQGPESSSQGGAAWTATSYTMNIQRVTIWVCPNPTGGTWQTTGQCYVNPVITTHP
jgi:hypothetical protein